MRFLMSKFVSPTQEHGQVSYEELVKYLAKCIGQLNTIQQQQQQINSSRVPNQTQQYFPTRYV